MIIHNLILVGALVIIGMTVGLVGMACGAAFHTQNEPRSGKLATYALLLPVLATMLIFAAGVTSQVPL